MIFALGTNILYCLTNIDIQEEEEKEEEETVRGELGMLGRDGILCV